jgi:hypothetical protein
MLRRLVPEHFLYCFYLLLLPNRLFGLPLVGALPDDGFAFLADPPFFLVDLLIIKDAPRM